ncbi:MAG: hypothetical protein K0B07_05830 [DPANN group archaeon]|nr:hypothetical protein [DPANN group archaeon]
MKSEISMNCCECGHKNIIPISKFYDAFDGTFTCLKCGMYLDDANDALDE